MQSVESTPLRLMLLDDHDDARNGLAARLSRQPPLDVVGAVAEADEVFAIAQRLRADAVLVETRRADQRGLEAIAALAAMDRDERPAIIAYLEIVHRDDWASARMAGADDVLLKELPPEALAGELRRIVDRVRQRTDRT